MRTAFLVFAVLRLAGSSTYGSDQLPRVEDDYRSMRAGDHLGDPIEEIIAVDEIQRIVLLNDRLNAHWENEPGYTADQAIKMLFEQTKSAKNFGRLAEEGVVAELLVVNKKGEVFLVDVLRQTVALNQLATAFTLRGKGFGCRFELRDSKYKAR